MVRGHSAIWLAFATAVFAVNREAHAQRKAMVLESYEVQKPENADVAISILRDEFDKLGYLASIQDLKHHLGAQLPLPASEPVSPDPPAPISTSKARASDQRTKAAPDPKTKPANPRSSPAALLKELSDVHARWLQANEPFETLKPALSKAVEDGLASPALLVTDPTIRDKLRSALLDLALINGKLVHKGDSREAKLLARAQEDWMAEWIRTYGETNEITENRDGREADTLYNQVRDNRDKAGRGTLSIEIDDSSVQLYVDESIRSLHRPVADLFPGRYRALLMGPGDDARLFLPEVLPHQVTRLIIDWSVAMNLFVSDSSVAFVVSTPSHANPAVLACKLARSVGDSSIALMGLEAIDGAWRVTSALYSAQSGRLVRGGYTFFDKQDMAQLVRTGHAVFATGDMRRRLAALALFVARGVRDPAVAVTGDNAAALDEINQQQTDGSGSDLVADKPIADGRHPVGKWMVAGGAAIMLALGSASLYEHYTCGAAADNCKYIYPRAGLIGYSSTGAGVGLGALAAYWFYRDGKASDPRIAVKIGSSGVAVNWTTEF